MRSTFAFYWKKGVSIIFISIAWGLVAYAADVEVSSRLSDQETILGKPVQLEITVQGSRNAEIPRDLGVDGLQIRYAGESVQIQMVNFQVSASSSYTFIILPLRAGDFTIPGLEVKVNGKKFRTKPLNLKVNDSRGSWTRGSTSGSQGATQTPSSITIPAIPSSSQINASQTNKSTDLQTDKLAFGVLRLPKKKMYVGEVVPVEIRYYFHPNLPLQSINSMPSLVGDDFVVRKMSESQQGRQEINGVKYMVVSFRSSIRPLKPGEFQLPSTSISCQVLTQTRPEIPESLLPDAFFQRFLDAMPGIARVQRLDVSSDPVTIQAMPLPEENRPSSFRGAVGNFSLQTEVSPQDPSPGDPVTLSATLSGEGNFDQISAPELASKQGWQTYPPASKFMGSDPVEYSGKKIFEWMLVPKENKIATPALEFSYFNPNLNKYVTLHGAPQAIHAAPAPNTLSTPLGAVATSPNTNSSLPFTSAKKEEFKIARHRRVESFRPITKRPEFIITNGAAFLALLAFLGIQFARYYAVSGGRNKAALRRSLMAYRAQASVAQGKEFYSAVVEFLRLRATALKRGIKVYSGEEVVDTLGLQGKEAELVLKVFSQYEELAYGARGIQRPLSAEIRAAILDLLKEK